MEYLLWTTSKSLGLIISYLNLLKYYLTEKDVSALFGVRGKSIVTIQFLHIEIVQNLVFCLYLI